MPGYRMGTEPGSGRQRSKQRPDRWKQFSAVLSIALLLTTIPAGVWTRPADIAQAQGEVAASDPPSAQVIAQGIARLPRGEVAWTVRSIDVPGGEGTPVESFPVGFVVADGTTVALLDEEGEILGILADGEAAFLPNGKRGALASWEGDAARLYEVALVSDRDVDAGETPGTVVGNPFTAPSGAAFDIEIARATLARDEQATIPVSRSGTPVLFLQTAGSVQLEGGGQVVALAAGQHAMLLGEVVARGASDEPATFVIATIGEATAAGDAAEGTPEARAGEDRVRARNGAAQGEDTPRAERTREKRPKRVRTGGGGGGGGQAGQTAPQGAGGGTGGAPVTGGVAATVPTGLPVGSPELEPIAEATPPADTTAPVDGTPAPDVTAPPVDPAPGEGTAVADVEAPTGDAVTPEPTAPAEESVEGEPTPTSEAPQAEDALPIEEAPLEDAPATEAIEEEPVAEPTAGA